MKVRNGFVSNSSSSSFLIYGTVTSFDEDVLSRLKEKYPDYDCWNEDNEIEDPRDLIEYIWKKNKVDFSYSMDCPYDDEYYIGRSWDTVRDNETGKQFKESTEKILKEIFGDDVKVSTLEEAYYN